MFGSDPVLHPDDRPDPDERGPWLRLLSASVVLWGALFLADRRLLTDGTFLQVTAKVWYTLLVAPLAAALVLQDAEALAVHAGVDLGRVRWAYALAALPFPPVVGLYLLHRTLRTRRSGGDPE